MATVDLVKNWLSTEGYKYDVDGDGDVHFKYEGINYYFTVDNNDQSFFRIIMPAIYKVEGNRARVLEAANTITRDIKVLKAFLVEDYLWLTVEMFLDASPEIEDFFPRCLSIMQRGREMIAKEIFD